MKTLTLVLSTLIFSCSWLLAHPTTEDSFVSAWKSAVESKDLAAIEKLTYTDGLTEENRKLVLANDWLERITEIKSVSLEPLPEDFQTGGVSNGRKSELLKTPIGLIKVEGQPWSNMKPYAVIDGKYYVIAAKVTKLNWQGPPDQTWNFHVIGKGSEKVKVELAWNASGVDLTREFKRSSSGFPGQYISSIKVTCPDPDSDLVLKIFQGDKDFYKSAPHKGVGVIEYKKPD
jgi:hypothetical protein